MSSGAGFPPRPASPAPGGPAGPGGVPGRLLISLSASAAIASSLSPCSRSARAGGRPFAVPTWTRSRASLDSAASRCACCSCSVSFCCSDFCASAAFRASSASGDSSFTWAFAAASSAFMASSARCPASPSGASCVCGCCSGPGAGGAGGLSGCGCGWVKGGSVEGAPRCWAADWPGCLASPGAGDARMVAHGQRIRHRHAVLAGQLPHRGGVGALSPAGVVTDLR